MNEAQLRSIVTPHNFVLPRNPAPSGIKKKPLNNGINYQPQLVEGFFHQQYCIIHHDSLTLQSTSYTLESLNMASSQITSLKKTKSSPFCLHLLGSNR